MCIWIFSCNHDDISHVILQFQPSVPIPNAERPSSNAMDTKSNRSISTRAPASSARRKSPKLDGSVESGATASGAGNPENKPLGHVTARVGCIIERSRTVQRRAVVIASPRTRIDFVGTSRRAVEGRDGSLVAKCCAIALLYGGYLLAVFAQLVDVVLFEIRQDRKRPTSGL